MNWKGQRPVAIGAIGGDGDCWGHSGCKEQQSSDGKHRYVKAAIISWCDYVHKKAVNAVKNPMRNAGWNESGLKLEEKTVSRAPSVRGLCGVRNSVSSGIGDSGQAPTVGTLSRSY